MSWGVRYIPEAVRDLERLDGSQRILVRKAIAKASGDPRPQSEGGYGKPLGHRGGRDLTGLLKLKLRSAGLRIVYTLLRQDEKMLVIVIGVRADDEVYDIAEARAAAHQL